MKKHRTRFTKIDVRCSYYPASGTATLHNDFMPVVPVVTTTVETTLRWAIDGESFHKTVSAGTWEIPELESRYGDNTVSVAGDGTSTFTYRQGRL